jgi:hypothetical protein
MSVKLFLCPNQRRLCIGMETEKVAVYKLMYHNLKT